jgi:hypothetical protein
VVSALAPVLRYILEVNEHVERGAVEALLEREIGPETKDTIVAFGIQLIEQDFKLGFEQGVKQMRERFHKLLLSLLRQRFGDAVNTDVEQRIASASVDEIETWSMRVASATTLAEVFAD